MTLRSTFLTDTIGSTGFVFALGLAAGVAAFLLLSGIGPESLPFPVDNAYSDAVTSHWPNALFLRRSVLDDHTFPLWRPLIMSGQPFSANPLNKAWYPPQWLVLLVQPAAHLNILAWLHLVLAGVGSWTWGRETGLMRWPAALAAVGYTFAPRVIAAFGAGHLDLVYAAAWLPWLLWSVHRLTAPGARTRSALWCGIFAALIVLADVRLGAYGLALASAYGAVRIWSQHNGRKRAKQGRVLGRAVIALLIAAGLTAPLWVPLLIYRADLSRGDLTLEEAAVESLSAGQWIGLVFGNHGGAWESMVYVGISTLALAAVTLIQRPRQFIFWWLVIAFVALYAMGNQFVLWTALNRLFPLLRWWRVPPRAWLLAAWILPYLAAWGAQLLATQPAQRRFARLGVVALLGGGMACGIFSALVLAPALELSAALGVFALPLTALVMLLALTRRLPAQIVLIAFTLIVLLDVVWIDRTLVEGRHQRDWLDPHRELAEYLSDQDVTRVYSPSYSLPQQAAAYWQIPQFGGVDPFQFDTYIAAFQAATGTSVEGYSITLPPYIYDDKNDDQDSDLTFDDILLRANRDAQPRADLLAHWRVSHVIADFEIDAPGLVFETQIGDTRVYRNTLLLDAAVTWDGPNHVTVRVPPGTDGPLYAVANGHWQNVPDATAPGLPGALDSAAESWTLAYDPSEVWYGLAAMGMLLVLAASIWWGVARA